MKKVKILFLCIFAIFIIALLGTKSYASLDLNTLNFDVKVNEDGSMNVTETWDIDISETNTLFKTFEIDRSKYSTITDVKVTETTKNTNKEFSKINQEMYHVTKDCYYGLINSKGVFEIAWGVGLDDSSANRVYQISYKVNDAIAKYNDYAELYWKFVGDDFEIPANKIYGKITLPRNAQNKEDIRVWGHTKYLNGEIYATNLNTIEFNLSRYSGGEYVEVRSLFPNYIIDSSTRTYNYNILDDAIEEETVWADQANARRKNRENIIKLFLTIVGVTAVFFIYKAIKNIIKLNKMEKKYKPTTKLEYFRELPYEHATPSEALFVISSGLQKSFPESFSANILDLCLKKYISLEVIQGKGIFKSDEVKITLLVKPIDDLKDDEKLTLKLLKEIAKDSDVLTTKDITKYFEKHTSKVEKLNIELGKIVEQEQTNKNNYNKDKENEKSKYIGFSVVYIILAILSIIFIPTFLSEMNYISYIGFAVLLMVSLLANGIILAVMAGRVNVFSQQGIDEKEKWKALKKYMEDFSLLKEREVPELVLWEKFLVFATAFGISEKVLKQLKVVYPEMNDMNSMMYTYSYIHVMNNIDIGKCINQSVYSAVSSSGSGAGGGFSGGGGGGRWPEADVEDVKSLLQNV